MKPRCVLTVLALALLLAACQPADQVETTPDARRTQPPTAPSSPTALPPAAMATATPAPAPPPSDGLLPQDFTYLGAFRLPDGGERPLTFEYGGSAMTFNPDGDPAGPSDGFPGSLFITGHDRLAYGELPDGSQVAEIDIPQPVKAGSPYDLNQAGFLQDFANVTAGYFTGIDEIPRIGMLYLDAPATGPKIHLGWGQHLNPDEPFATHIWFSPDLSAPDVQGPWSIGEESLYAVNGYLFEIPADWAASYSEGRVIVTGRFRDGGWAGMGPSLFAYRPWLDESGAAPAAGTHLEDTVLLRYQSSLEGDNFARAMTGYQHPDEWEGGAWITAGAGRSAVLFAGTKSVGARYWYGYLNPAGPDAPCVEGELADQFTECRLADGSPCPPQEQVECSGHTSMRGWWSTRFDAEFILYDPADLARVAAGAMQPWEPQPYAAISIDDTLFLNPDGIEPEMLGTGPQRRYRIGDVAYDRASGLLYVLELFAEGAKPVVHVWRVE